MDTGRGRADGKANEPWGRRAALALLAALLCSGGLGAAGVVGSGMEQPLRPPAEQRHTDAAPRDTVPRDTATVVLVHGLGRRAASMAPLGRALVDRGYRVINVGYPSWTEGPDSLTALLSDSVAACCGADSTVAFVTHSLGGVLVRNYLSKREQPYAGRVVMLSPPNQGSELVDVASAAPWLAALLGPTGAALGTEETSLPNRLEAPDYPVGIITGDRSLNPLYSWLIPGPDDGKVSVERAELEGAPLLVVPFSHSFIMNQVEVVDEVDHFLREGRFSQEAMDRWGHEHDKANPDGAPGLPPPPDSARSFPP